MQSATAKPCSASARASARRCGGAAAAAAEAEAEAEEDEEEEEDDLAAAAAAAAAGDDIRPAPPRSPARVVYIAFRLLEPKPAPRTAAFLDLTLVRDPRRS